jgi:RecA/RadA recombinase
MFTDSHLRGIVATIKDYYRKYGSMISYEMLTIKINEKTQNEDERQYYWETIEKLKHTTTEGHEEIEEMAERFFKQQNMIKVANKLKEIAGDGDLSKYDECQRILEEAMAIGRKSNDESHPFDTIDEDLSTLNVTTIPTGIERLDEILGGGLDKGKVGLIICPMGAGKTSMTTCIAGNAAAYRCEKNNYEGYKVLQIVFEDKPRDMHRKYIAKLSQVEAKDLNKDEETVDFVKSILNNHEDRELINNNIIVKKLDTGEVKASDIKEIIRKKINEGFKPDLVIIDYFECIEPEYGSAKSDITEKEGRTMRKFETMAGELDVAIWIPTQGNRDSIKAEVVTNAEVGGSIRKNQIAQVVLSVARSTDDIKNKRATIAVLKNRSGGAGVVLNGVIFDNGTCTISCDNVINFDSVIAYNEYAEEKEAERKENMKNEAKKLYRK